MNTEYQLKRLKNIISGIDDNEKRTLSYQILSEIGTELKRRALRNKKLRKQKHKLIKKIKRGDLCGQ